MMIWFSAAVLTAAVVAVLIAPLALGARRETSRRDHDVAVYRDQLGEVDRDVAAGQLAPDEAELARAEIGRRLLKAAGQPSGRTRAHDANPRNRRTPFSRIAAIGAVVVALPVVGLGTYLEIGSPGVPAAPLASREAGPNGDPELARLIGQAEERLRADPNDGRGWEVLAPIYARVGRLGAARAAYENAIRLLGSTAERQSGLGEVLVRASGGRVGDDARQAFETAARLAPDDPEPAFYLAVAMAQNGRRRKALDAFRALEAKAGADASWLPAVQNQIAALGATPAGSGESRADIAPDRSESGKPGLKSPTPEQVEAAGALNDEGRAAMIRGMVDRLDARLRTEPDNIEGWMRLVRSYMVLGETEKAGSTLDRALAVFPAGSKNAGTLLALADELGVRAKETTQ